MHSLILFASGKGSNVVAINEYFKQNGKAKVSLIVCNKQGAGVIDYAIKEGIPHLLVDKKQFADQTFIDTLQPYQPSLLVLAGFLWKVPESVVNAFAGKIINIHPSLLPKYGGKGMYGHHVHEAVIAAKEKQSGITIHYVNEAYDEGGVIVQATCEVKTSDTADSLAKRIHQLEHFFFPKTIEFLL